MRTALEVMKQVSEAGKLQQMLACGGLVYGFMFKDPGELMRYEDSMQASAECRVDVRSRTIANHPGTKGLAAMMSR